MPVKFSQVELNLDSSSSVVADYVGFDHLAAPVWWRDGILRAVREIMVERSDCNRIPKVIGFKQCPRPDAWGNSFFIEVEYHTRGYRALYAAPASAVGYQCYMD